MHDQPRAPLDRWPIQHRDPNYGFAWYLGRGIIVSQVVAAHGTATAAHTYHNFEERILRERAPELSRHGGLFVIHDWRAMLTYDAEARRVWQERMKERERGYLRGSIVCVARSSALLKMAVQAVNVVASLLHGCKIELTEDVEVALREAGVQGGPTAPSLAPSR